MPAPLGPARRGARAAAQTRVRAVVIVSGAMEPPAQGGAPDLFTALRLVPPHALPEVEREAEPKGTGWGGPAALAGVPEVVPNDVDPGEPWPPPRPVDPGATTVREDVITGVWPIAGSPPVPAATPSPPARAKAPEIDLADDLAAEFEALIEDESVEPAPASTRAVPSGVPPLPGRGASPARAPVPALRRPAPPPARATPRPTPEAELPSVPPLPPRAEADPGFGAFPAPGRPFEGFPPPGREAPLPATREPPRAPVRGSAGAVAGRQAVGFPGTAAASLPASRGTVAPPPARTPAPPASARAPASAAAAGPFAGLADLLEPGESGAAAPLVDLAVTAAPTLLPAATVPAAVAAPLAATAPMPGFSTVEALPAEPAPRSRAGLIATLIALVVMLVGALAWILVTKTDVFGNKEAPASAATPAAPAPPIEYGTIEIDSTPPKARVFWMQPGPAATFPGLPPDGQYMVAVTAPGHAPQIRVLKGSELEAPIVIDLDPLAEGAVPTWPEAAPPKVGRDTAKPATLELRTHTPDASLGLLVGYTPGVRVIDLDVAKKHTFLVLLAGHEPVTLNVAGRHFEEEAGGTLLYREAVTLSPLAAAPEGGAAGQREQKPAKAP
jgi:hypothetical protein